MFYPERLTIARLRAGFSKKALAEAVGVSPRTISNYESGSQQPEAPTLARLSGTLNFPIGFFQREVPHAADRDMREEISFRARSSITMTQQDMAIASVLLAMEIQRWLRERLTLPDIDVPDLRDCRDNPEQGALLLRRLWQLGHGPLKNLLTIVERHGIMVFSLAMDSEKVDAFSIWQDGIPIIFLNMRKTPERCRFDLAHELAHLVLHRAGQPQGREIEQEADQFASALLMPKDAMMMMPLRLSTIDHLIPIKKHWDVSLAALNYRLHKLGRISEWAYRTNCIHLSRIGRDKEPDGKAHFEPSLLWEKTFSALQKANISKENMAAELGLNLARLHELTFGLQVYMGHGKTTAPISTDYIKIIK